jgi:uncharacterized membrane protein
MAKAPVVGIFALALLLALSGPALAHDCSSPADCEQTAGYNAVIAVAGGVLALAAGLFGNAIGGGETAAPTGEAPTPRRRRGCLSWFTMIAAVPLTLIVVAIRAIAG